MPGNAGSRRWSLRIVPEILRLSSDVPRHATAITNAHTKVPGLPAFFKVLDPWDKAQKHHLKSSSSLRNSLSSNRQSTAGRDGRGVGRRGFGWPHLWDVGCLLANVGYKYP